MRTKCAPYLRATKLYIKSFDHGLYSCNEDRCTIRDQIKEARLRDSWQEGGRYSVYYEHNEDPRAP